MNEGRNEGSALSFDPAHWQFQSKFEWTNAIILQWRGRKESRLVCLSEESVRVYEWWERVKSRNNTSEKRSTKRPFFRSTLLLCYREGRRPIFNRLCWKWNGIGYLGCLNVVRGVKRAGTRNLGHNFWPSLYSAEHATSTHPLWPTGQAPCRRESIYVVRIVARTLNSETGTAVSFDRLRLSLQGRAK